MKLTVTSAHISRGKRNDSTKCPVANCFKEEFPKAVKVEVSDGHEVEDLHSGEHVLVADVEVHFKDRTKYFNLNKTTIERINKYDRGGEMKPFTFTCEEDFPDGKDEV